MTVDLDALEALAKNSMTIAEWLDYDDALHKNSEELIRLARIGQRVEGSGPCVVVPARERGLIWGAALVALHGLESELQSLCFARGYETDSDLNEVRRVRNAYENREQVTTKHRWILDRMAHTAQTIRVSSEEWESVVPIRSGREEDIQRDAMLAAAKEEHDAHR